MGNAQQCDSHLHIGGFLEAMIENPLLCISVCVWVSENVQKYLSYVKVVVHLQTSNSVFVRICGTTFTNTVGQSVHNVIVHSLLYFFIKSSWQSCPSH